MVQFNTRANEILLKLVYYGPGLSGKTTNLQSLHAMSQDTSRGDMFSVNTQEDRTLFFDLLPINLGYIYGNAIHLQIYTVPGQVQYDASRRVVLGGADGVVFVADSSEAKMQDNVDSLSNLYHNLNANRLNIKQIPFVLQYNKRDLPDAMPVGVMNRRLNFRNVPYFEAVAYKGTGVIDTFLSITRETVATTFRKYHLDKKIKDFDEMLNLIDTNIRSNMHELAPTEVVSAPQDSTILRHSNVSIDDLVPGKIAEPQDLLEDALKSNMETARLYSELKQSKESLEKKNVELNDIYAQLDRANQDNLKTRRYLEGLIQSMSEAVISFSHDGRVLTWNGSAERIFGFPRTEIVGKNMNLLIPTGRSGEMEQAVALVSQGQTLRDLHTVRLRRDGSEFQAAITYAPVRGGDDRVLAYSALVRDLGEYSGQGSEPPALGRILPTIVNDVANRLNPVLIQSRLLEDSASGPGAASIHKLTRAVEGVQSLLRPIVMLLHPANPRLDSVDIGALVRDCLHRLEGESAATGVTVDSSLDPTLGSCGVDGDQLHEAVMGMLRNAIQTAGKSGHGGRVRVGTRLSGESFQIAVQDSGAPIPDSQQNLVFDPASAHSIEALGLPVAAMVVREHGGRISLRSQDGTGNLIVAEMPFIPPAPPVAAPKAGLAGKQALVVDDEPFLLECLVEALQAWGCTVTACPSGEDAVAKLEANTFDLMVSDIRMPGLSGIQLFEWVKEHRPGLLGKMLFTTGDSFDQETRGFLDRSQVAHLGKPFDLKKLRQSLEDLVAS
jgi:hypothetical protein